MCSYFPSQRKDITFLYLVKLSNDLCDVVMLDKAGLFPYLNLFKHFSKIQVCYYPVLLKYDRSLKLTIILGTQHILTTNLNYSCFYAHTFAF